jgi:hypothetical protein
MGKFSDGLKRDIEQSLLMLDTKITETVTDAMTFIVDFSPTRFIGAKYAEGVFVNSWYAAINEFDGTVGGNADMSGGASRQRIAAIKTAKPFYRQDGFVSFVNNLDYSQNVEFDGWASVPAYAPVRQSILYLLRAYKK